MQAMAGTMWALGVANKAPAFMPSDLANLALWLKADALTLNDGDAVSSWTDSSGNNRHATETLTNRPTYKTNIINGKPVVRFGGGHRLLISAPVLTLAHSIFIVFTPVLEAALHYFLMQWTLGQTGRFAVVSNSTESGTPTAGRMYFWNQTESAGAGSSGQLDDFAISAVPTIVSETHNTGTENFKVWKNGVLIDSATVTAIYTGINTTIGAQNPATAGSLKADIAEIIAYSAALSDTDRGGVQTYLATKYGITLA